jgi:putative colanic acid biosynthesis acetyltransferase WcaF
VLSVYDVEWRKQATHDTVNRGDRVRENSTRRVQNLEVYKVDPKFRGRSPYFVQLWWIVQATLFRGSPQVCYGFRRWLLRIFGAQVGHGAIIRPSVTVTYPWRVKIGAHSQIGDDVVIYSYGDITIGNSVVVSQKSYLCAGTHNFLSEAFELQSFPIVIEDHVWLAADVFVAPGVTVGQGAVVGARSSVFSNLPDYMICTGSPAKPVRARPRSPQETPMPIPVTRKAGES